MASCKMLLCVLLVAPALFACRLVAVLVQGWSGLIQRSIYKQVKRARAKWEHKEQDKLERRTSLALHAQTLIKSSDMHGSIDLPSPCAASKGELGRPQLRADRIAAVAGSPRASPSPFELIAGGSPTRDGKEALAGGSTGRSSQDLSGSVSPQSSGPEDMTCVLDAQQQSLGTTGWQSSPAAGSSLSSKASYDQAAAL
jgi:hypothetical protein